MSDWCTMCNEAPATTVWFAPVCQPCADWLDWLDRELNNDASQRA